MFGDFVQYLRGQGAGPVHPGKIRVFVNANAFARCAPLMLVGHGVWPFCRFSVALRVAHYLRQFCRLCQSGHRVWLWLQKWQRLTQIYGLGGNRAIIGHHLHPCLHRLHHAFGIVRVYIGG